jgi:hypothetical protein
MKKGTFDLRPGQNDYLYWALMASVDDGPEAEGVVCCCSASRGVI